VAGYATGTVAARELDGAIHVASFAVEVASATLA